jgi:hypothetical protein
MASNLTNVYANLRQTFEDVDMELSKPLSYVKTLTGIESSEKVVFVYKQVIIGHVFIENCN